MATYDEAYDWDNLSDEDWNKKLDEKIAQFNEGRGEVKLPPPSTAIMTTSMSAASTTSTSPRT